MADDSSVPTPESELCDPDGHVKILRYPVGFSQTRLVGLLHESWACGVIVLKLLELFILEGFRTFRGTPSEISQIGNFIKKAVFEGTKTYKLYRAAKLRRLEPVPEQGLSTEGCLRALDNSFVPVQYLDSKELGNNLCSRFKNGLRKITTEWKHDWIEEGRTERADSHGNEIAVVGNVGKRAFIVFQVNSSDTIIFVDCHGSVTLQIGAVAVYGTVKYFEQFSDAVANHLDSLNIDERDDLTFEVYMHKSHPNFDKGKEHFLTHLGGFQTDD